MKGSYTAGEKYLREIMKNKFEFSKDGFEIFPFLSDREFSIVQHFAIEKLNSLFLQYTNRPVSAKDIVTYHLWGKEKEIPHKELFKAKNRHMQGTREIRELLIESKLKSLLSHLGIDQFKIWDEGLGWLAFRLIRPGPGDGYPFSCKNWGPAKNVLSAWMPILGFSQDVMIHLIPGSHLKDYPKYLPKETHFTKDEYRLDLHPDKEECIRPKMRPGEILLFHPKTLHAEEVEKGFETRFNLEFRLEPL
jgi:hypothetical protein